MSHIPSELKYTKSHEWIRQEDDGVVIGITDHAQTQLGDLVYVELPEVGDRVDTGDEVGTLESVKTAADIFNPVAGNITAVNDALEEAPGLINSDAYGDGWLYKLKIDDPEELETLLDADDYQDFLAEQSE